MRERERERGACVCANVCVCVCVFLCLCMSGVSVLPHVRTCCVCEKKILHHNAHAHHRHERYWHVRSEEAERRCVAHDDRPVLGVSLF